MIKKIFLHFLHFSPKIHRPAWGEPRYAKRPGHYGILRPMFGSAVVYRCEVPGCNREMIKH